MKTKAAILHTSIDDLLLSKFIACLCKQEYTQLVIDGEATLPDLLEAWSNLYAQFLDLMGDSESEYMLQLQKEIGLLTFKISTVQSILEVLWIIHDDRLVEVLKAFGFDTRKLTRDNGEYRKELTRISNRLAKFRLRLQERTNELIAYQDSKGEGEEKETINETYFTKQLARLSRFQGYRLRANEITVAEFGAVFKEYLNHFKAKHKTFDDGEKG